MYYCANCLRTLFCVNDVGAVPFPKYTREAIHICSKANIVWRVIMSAVKDMPAIKKLNAVSQGHVLMEGNFIN